MKPTLKQLKKLADRASKMYQLKKRGWTLKKIGNLYRVSRQRVSQILNSPPR